MILKRCVFWLILGGLVLVAGVYYKTEQGKKGMKSHPEYHLQALEGIKNIIPVAIIGSGPGGLSAALYTSRMNLFTVVFQGPMPGGQLMGTSDVENWPGAGIKKGPDMMRDVQKQAEQFGAHMMPHAINKVDLHSWPFKLVMDDGREVFALSVIIATGSNPKRLGLEPKETQYWGKGLSTCAVCDAAFYKGKRVSVVGGGDSAMEMALELAHHALEVILLARGDSLRASPIMQQRVRETKNITIRFSTTVTDIEGNEKHVTGIKLNDGSSMAIDGLFLAIGHDPNTQLFKDQIQLDNVGYIVLQGRSQRTSVPGVLAAGDVADYVYRQAGVASGDGIKAALDAAAFLRDCGFNDEAADRIQTRLFNPSIIEKRITIPAIKNGAEIDELVRHETRPIVLDFFAPYCPSCMRMLPIIESLAADLSDKIVFRKVDISKLPDVANRFEVSMIPTMLVVHKTSIVSRSTEVMNRQQMHDYFGKFVELHEMP